jgi:hypothetical protein
MNTNYSTWFWDSTQQNQRQAQGFEYFEIDFGLSPNPPSIDVGGPYSGSEGSPITFNASASDLDGDLLNYRWDYDEDGIYDTGWSSSNSLTHTWYDDHIGTVTVQVCDGQWTSTDTTLVVVSNVAPTADFNNNGPKDEGNPVTVSFSNQYDPGIFDTFTYSFDWENDGVYNIVDQIIPSASHTWGDNGIFKVKGKIKDDDDGYTEYTTNVIVENVPPTIIDLFMSQPNPQFILPHVHDLIFSGSFTDPGWLDTHIGTWDFGDTTSISGNVIEENNQPDATGNITGDHVYTTPGDYTITLTVSDDDGGTDVEILEVEVVNEFGALQDLNDYIQNLSDNAFKNLAMIRKMIINNKISVVFKMLDNQIYENAINKLNNDIRTKADGYIDGNPTNDWIIDSEAQYHICMKIDDLTAYLDYLIANPP